MSYHLTLSRMCTIDWPLVSFLPCRLFFTPIPVQSLCMFELRRFFLHDECIHGVSIIIVTPVLPSHLSLALLSGQLYLISLA